MAGSVASQIGVEAAPSSCDKVGRPISEPPTFEHVVTTLGTLEPTINGRARSEESGHRKRQAAWCPCCKSWPLSNIRLPGNGLENR